VADPAARRRHYTIDGRTVEAPALAGGLHVVSTPIGNLRDITLRALEALAAADLIACEDSRVTRKLLEHYGITTPLTPYHEHNAAEARPKLVARLAGGAAIALVSDAGTPLVSDPGFKLVRAAREAGHAVTALPGPSAPLAALAVSGLPTDRFFFEGFLPARESQRRARIEALKHVPGTLVLFEAGPRLAAALAVSGLPTDRFFFEGFLPAREAQRRARIEALKHIPGTLVLFETGPRLAAALAALADGLGHRDAAVCRELTKLHEEVRRGDLVALAGIYSAADAETRGEIAIVIAPPPKQETDAADLDALLRNALDRLSVKEAVAEIAAVTGHPRRAVYQRALALAQDHGEDPQ